MPGSRPPGAEGLGPHGTTGGHFSGDILLAFTTANAGALGSSFPIERPEVGTLRSLEMVPWGYLDPFYAAVVHCIEEAVLNALVSNATSRSLSPWQGELLCSSEDIVEHRLGESSGERVLLARVVAAKEDDRCARALKMHLCAVAEFWSWTRYPPAALCQGAKGCSPSEAAEGDDDAH